MHAKKKKNKLNMADREYTLGEIIGKGTYGNVHKATRKNSRNSTEIYAVKKIDFTNSNRKELEQMGREEGILRQLCSHRHENIVQYITSYKDTKAMYIVMEYCANGSLYSYLQEIKTGLDEDEYLVYITQIANGVKYLHSKSIIHRDLKTKNILLTSDNRIKIADFGVAKYRMPGIAAQTVYAGTAHYMPPEMTQGEGKYGEKVDIWAMGCDCYEMGTSEYAFTGNNFNDIQEAVKKNKLRNMNAIRFCDGMKDLILKMLSTKAGDRPDADTVYKEVSCHSCSNLQRRNQHKETQVFAITSPRSGNTFLASTSEKRLSNSNKASVSEDGQKEENDRHPTQNTDSCVGESLFHKSSILDTSSNLSTSGSFKKAIQNTDPKVENVSDKSLSDSTRSSRSSTSSLPEYKDQFEDILITYQEAQRKFHDKLFKRLNRDRGSRAIFRELSDMIDNHDPDFEANVLKCLGERYIGLKSLVMTLKNLEEGIQEYTSKS